MHLINPCSHETWAKDKVHCGKGPSDQSNLGYTLKHTGLREKHKGGMEITSGWESRTKPLSETFHGCEISKPGG